MDVVVIVGQRSLRLSSQHSTLITKRDGLVANAVAEKSGCRHAPEMALQCTYAKKINVALTSTTHSTENHACIRL